MSQDPSTVAAHAGSLRDPGASSAPAIHLGSFCLSQGDPGALPYAYARHGNPTWEQCEAALGALENAKALVFASGQAASLALMLSLGEEHKRIVAPGDGYYGTRKLGTMLAVLGFELVATDLADLAAVERELARGKSILWAETPTNPFLRVFDLERLSVLARAAGAPLVVDNTTATAALQLPLEWGATATVTSLTKSAAGHSDILLGSIATRDQQLFERARNWRANAGLIAGPFECWAALRGLRTLPLRIERQSQNALAIAQHLSRDPRVTKVHYPGLDASTSALTKKQMPPGAGPLLSFEVRGGAVEADRLVGGARLIRPGTSFGGVESSWERRARWSSETAPPSLVRLSTGIEAIADLLTDIDHALGELG